VRPSAQNVDFHAEKQHGDSRFVDLRKTHGVFLGRNQGIKRAPVTPLEETQDFFFGEPVVVGERLGDFHNSSQRPHALLETFRPGNAAHGSDMPALEMVEREPLSCFDILPVAGAMGALDDGGCAVEAAQAGQQVMVGFRSAFGDNDVGGAAEVGRRFSQRAPGQQAFVTERRLLVDKDDVQAVAETLILQTIVQEKDVAVEVLQGVPAAFDAILVDQDANAGKVFRQHVRFVAGPPGIKQDLAAVRDDAGREKIGLSEKTLMQALGERTGDTFVTTAENSHPASSLVQFTGQHLGHGSFASAAHREIADTDHRATQFLRPDETTAVKGQPRLNGPRVSQGEKAEENLQRIGPTTFTALENNIDGIALETFEKDAHRFRTRGARQYCPPAKRGPGPRAKRSAWLRLQLRDSARSRRPRRTPSR